MENPIILTLLISLATQAVFFSFAWTWKTDKVTDLSYGLTFIIIALFWLKFDGRLVSSFRFLIAFMITVWALRLSGYLLYRVIKTGRDKRYDEMRNSFTKFGRFWLLQGLSVWLISMPGVYLLSRDVVPKLGIVTLVGLYIWAQGLIIETIADAQLNKFRFKKDTNGSWIDEGLWHYSRHPNYFGEIILWWGVFIAGITTYEGLGWLTIIGPLTITGLLLFGSGIPILEKAAQKRWGHDPQYQIYKRSTSILIPLPKKRSAAK